MKTIGAQAAPHSFQPRSRSRAACARALPRAGSVLAAALLAWFLVTIVVVPRAEAAGPVDETWATLWQEDLRYLGVELSQRHPDPFTVISEEELAVELEQLIGRVPESSHSQIVVALAALVARIEDGHSRVTLPMPGLTGFWSGHAKTPEPKVPGLMFGHLPVRFRVYPGGLYVQRAMPEHADLAGGRVLRIGDLSAKEAMQVVGNVAHRDNDWQRDLNLADLLAVPEVLEATGVVEAASSVPMILVGTDGEEIAVELEPAATDKAPTWIEAFDPASTPLYLRHSERNYWFEFLQQQRTVYFQYNEVGNQDGEPDAETIEEFAERLTGVLGSHQVDKLVIDLRFNHGGSGGLNHPLLLALIRSPEVREVGSLFTIIGRGTFSAAMMFALDLERHTSTLFVGEPTGARLNHFGDSRKLTLPNTGLTVRISSLYWQYSDPRDQRDAIAPHLEADLSPEDYSAGRDPALEVILALGEPAPDVTSAAGGSWAGSIFFKPEQIAVTIHVEETDAGLVATLDVPAEDALGIPLENVRVEGDTLFMVLTAFGDPIRFSARVHGDLMLARADFGRRPVPFVLRRAER